MNRLAVVSVVLTALCVLSPTIGVTEQEAGETVLTRGQVTKDLYVAGRRVDVLAEVAGDVVAAGGRVAIDSQVMGDVIAAGGSLTLHGSVADDIRLTGFDVMINADIGDDVAAAGVHVLLAPLTTVGGDLMMSGGEVEMAGRVQGDASIAGGRIGISGQIDGNVELAGRSIEIGADAVILGDLTYRSPEAALIDPQARVEGNITHIPIPLPEKQNLAQGAIVGAVFLWLSLGLTGVVLYLLCPTQALAAATSATNEPWKALGLGLAMFAATPVANLMLLITGVGWLLAWLLWTLYCLLLLIGFFIGTLFVSNVVLQRIWRGREPTRFATSLAFLLILLLVMMSALVPVFGWLAVFVMLLFGIGGTTLRLYRTRCV